MRPIAMTTLTTVISMVPNAVAYGEAGAMMQGLALVNVGGLTASTILTLLLLPTFYRWYIRWEERKSAARASWSSQTDGHRRWEIKRFRPLPERYVLLHIEEASAYGKCPVCGGFILYLHFGLPVL